MQPMKVGHAYGEKLINLNSLLIHFSFLNFFFDFFFAADNDYDQLDDFSDTQKVSLFRFNCR